MIPKAKIICALLIGVSAPLVLGAPRENPAARPTTQPTEAVAAPPPVVEAPPGEILPAAATFTGEPPNPGSPSQFGAGSPASVARQPRQMSDAYRVLLTRSIFSKDHNRPAMPKRAFTATPTSLPSATIDPAASELAEANFVLKGVGIEDELPTAFFEQASDKKMVRVHLGQSVSHGQISAITLDGIDYAAVDKSVHVNIGESLSGISAGTSTTLGTATTQPSTNRASAWIKRHHED